MRRGAATFAGEGAEAWALGLALLVGIVLALLLLGL